MFIITFFLALVAACTCVEVPSEQNYNTEVQATPKNIDHVTLKIFTDLASPEAMAFGTRKTDVAYVNSGYLCGGSGATFDPACPSFSCTALQTCTVDTAFSLTGAQLTGAANTITATGGYEFDHPYKGFNTGDKGLVVGTNVVYTAFASPITRTQVTDGTFINAVSAFVKFTLEIPQFTTSIPSTYTFTIKKKSVDALHIDFKGDKTSQTIAVGWKVGTNLFPKWAVVCQLNATADDKCKFIECTAVDICAAQTNSAKLIGHAAGNALIERSTVLDTNYTITTGTQENLVFYYSTDSAPVPTGRSVNPLSWAKMSGQSITVAHYEQPPFTVTMRTTSPVNLQITMSTTDASHFAAVGWKRPGSAFPAYVYICHPGFGGADADACKDFVCNSASNVQCTGGNSLGSVVDLDKTARIAIVQRALTTPQHTITLGEQHLTWLEPSAMNAADIQGPDKDWKYMNKTISKFQGEKPTFRVSVENSTATTMKLSVVTTANKYAMVGFNDGVETFPKFVTICEPATQSKCGVYECTSATCTVFNDAVTQASNKVTRSAYVTFPKSAIGTDNPYLYWIEKDIPDSFSMKPNLAQAQTWKRYLQPIAPVTTNPTFPISFKRDTDTTLETTLVPGTGKTVIFGWRRTLDATYPTDALVCAPSTTIGNCLDVLCSTESNCKKRVKTIYSKNDANGTTATVKRNLRADDGVTIESNKDMYLAWDLIDTAANTTSLTAAELQGRTWKYYQSAVPVTGKNTSSADTYVPSFFAVVLALLYVMA